LNRFGTGAVILLSVTMTQAVPLPLARECGMPKFGILVYRAKT